MLKPALSLCRERAISLSALAGEPCLTERGANGAARGRVILDGYHRHLLCSAATADGEDGVDITGRRIARAAATTLVRSALAEGGPEDSVRPPRLSSPH